MDNYQDPALRGGQQPVNANPQPQQQYQQAPQQNYQQQGYQQPQQNYQQPQPNYQQQQNARPVKVGEWILTMFLTGIPVIGFILLLVWAFGSDTNKSKANWAKAQLLVMVIVGVLVTLFYIIMFFVAGAVSLADMNL